MPISQTEAATHRYRVDRQLKDPRMDMRGRLLLLWNYILVTEINYGTQFLRTTDGQLFVVLGGTDQIIKLPPPSRGGARWHAYFHAVYGLVENEPAARWIYASLLHHIQQYGTLVEPRRFAAYDRTTRTAYMSAYNGRMYKISGTADVEDLACGEDGVFFVDDDDGIHCTPDIGPHGILIDRLLDLNFAPSGLSGITPEQQRMALITWIFALGLPDLMRTKPLVLLEGVKGSGKCLQRGTPVIMFDGTIKPVEQIKDGELVMGPDSKPRRVGGLTVGHGPLYRITPTKGDSWVCNEDHILTVALAGNTNKQGEYIKPTELVDRPIKDFSPCTDGSRLGRNYAMLVRTGIEFPTQDLELDPYLVGLWLGDGTIGSAQITTPEPEIVAFCQAIAPRYGTTIRWNQPINRCASVNFTTGAQNWQVKTGRNRVLNFVRTLVVADEKRIPREYLINSQENRLALLAGLLDTDGYLGTNCYEIITKYAGLRDDILYLARSLGLAAYANEKIGRIKKLDFEGLYYRIGISGHVDQIPCKIPRKQATPRKQVKDALRTGFRIEPIGEGDYYGFTLDGDGRFLLGDFTITHNTFAISLIQHVLMGYSRPMILQRNKEDDFGVTLLRAPIALFDNTDSYIDWVPDAICSYATSGTWTRRRLYTDDESLVIKPHAFIAVASRNPASFRRDDVADRLLILRLERRETFTSVGKLEAEIEENRARLLGEYMWYLGHIVQRIRDTATDLAPDETHRMADFAAFARVVGYVLDWEAKAVEGLMAALQAERDAFVNEEDPLIDLLNRWCAYPARSGVRNVGRLINAIQLYAELETIAQGNGIVWKSSPRILAQNLRASHIEREFYVETKPIGGQKVYQIWRHSDPRLEIVGDVVVG